MLCSISYPEVGNETYCYYAKVFFVAPLTYLKFHNLKIQYWAMFGSAPETVTVPLSR